MNSRLLMLMVWCVTAWQVAPVPAAAQSDLATERPRFEVTWEPLADDAFPSLTTVAREGDSDSVREGNGDPGPDVYGDRDRDSHGYRDSDANGSGYIAVPRARGYGYSLQELFPVHGGDPSLQGVPAVSDPDPYYGVILFFNYGAFRGVPDGGWANFGLDTGINVASRLGRFSDLTGIGVQAGASIGVFNWAGTDYRLQNQGGAETQGFFTYGLYRRPTENSGILAAVVQDWSVNDNFSVFSQSPTLSQIRSQIGYATSASNEFGIWGTVHVISSTRDVAGFGPVSWQPINQISGYWHHKWHACGPDTWLSIGAPANTRLSGNGSVGDYLVTVAALAPLSDVVSLNTSATYMHQSAGQGGLAARDDAWNFMVGINIYPQRNSRSATVAGRRWMPLLPVANNGSFLVDASQNY